MKPAHRYATATAFRIALEARLKSLAQAEGIDLQRLRREVSFDRLLARLLSEPGAPWLLKGGYAMELRLRSARTTRDIDLSLPGEVERKGDVLERLQDRASMDMGDYFTFTSVFPNWNWTVLLTEGPNTSFPDCRSITAPLGNDCAMLVSRPRIWLSSHTQPR